MSAAIGRANSTACATLVDEWVRCGVRHAVVAPGSRSTPLAVALSARPEVAIDVCHDERVAGFVALGLGLEGPPAVLVCTSGTAAANFHPAIVEAGLSEIGMIVCTADRPPELRGVGAPQTIDQIELFGRAARWFHDARPPDEADPAEWRPLAQRVFATAEAGPVHLNLPFREPLLGDAEPLPPPIGPRLAVPRAIASHGPISAELDRQRGVIVVGGRHRLPIEAIEQLAERLGWPLLADPPSGCRALPAAATAFDAMLRHAGFAADHAPEVVIRIGRPPASRVLSEWVRSSGAPVVQVGGPGVIDPDHNVAWLATLDDLAPLTGAAGTPWAARWRHANAKAEAAIDESIHATAGRLTEPSVARIVSRHTGGELELVVAASMPMRDLEWFGGAWAHAHANRGANGIDGVVSTALGRALGGRSIVALVGDVAFLHDSNALVGLRQRGVDLRIVVVDNDGGGIFSFLPQAAQLEPATFEQLFGTPHGSDLVALARAHALAARDVATPDELVAALGERGPYLVRVATDRASNVEEHHRLNEAVRRALD